MAGIKFTASQSNITVNTGPVTLIQLQAATNVRVIVNAINVTLGAAVFCDVAIVLQSDAGTMSALTLVKNDTGSETLQTSGTHTASSEPTTSSTLLERAGSDVFDWWWPAGEGLIIPGGNRLGVICTSASSVGATCSIEAVE